MRIRNFDFAHFATNMCKMLCMAVGLRIRSVLVALSRAGAVPPDAARTELFSGTLVARGCAQSVRCFTVLRLCNLRCREQPSDSSRHHRLNVLYRSAAHMNCPEMRPIASDAIVGSLSTRTGQVDSGLVDTERHTARILSLPVSGSRLVIRTIGLVRSPVAEVSAEVSGRPWRVQTHSSSLLDQNTFVIRAPRGCLAVQICLHGIASS